MQRICYIHTPYQYLIFKTIIEQLGLEEKEFYIISFRKLNISSESQRYYVKENRSPMTFGQARKLIKEIKEIVKVATIGLPYELWLGSDDSPIGQILLCHKLTRTTILFEDGLGSYIPKSLKYNIFSRFFISKVKRLIYFIPYVRCIGPVGSNVPADLYCAFFDFAFPLRKKSCGGHYEFLEIDKEVFRKKVQSNNNMTKMYGIGKRKQEEAIILIDQPFVEGKYMSLDKYNREILDIVRKIEHKIRRKTCIIYKKHPGSLPARVSETVNFLKNYTGDEWVEIDDQYSFEEVILLKLNSTLAVVGFASTALYLSKLLAPKIPVYFKDPVFLHDKSPAFRDVRRFMESIGAIELN